MICEHKPNELHNQVMVSLGGGTGHFSWLRGVVQKNNPELNSAICATWDSGGVSGSLRVREGILSPGDYMQCIYGLIEDQRQLDATFILTKDRSGGDPLSHIIASRAERLFHGVEAGIDAIRDFLRVRGQVIPVSLIDVDLNAWTKNGQVFDREHKIDDKKNDLNFRLEDEISKIYFDNRPEANPKALTAIKGAEKVVIPPGSPYTSIFPHLLVKNVSRTILESEAKLVVVQNLMTTSGEDHHLRLASNWLKVFQYYLKDKQWIEKTGKSRINYLVVNNNSVDEEILKIYEAKGQIPTLLDEKECLRIAPGLEIINEKLGLYDEYAHLLRHDSLRLAETILSL